MADLSFWCYKNNDYLDYLRIPQVFELYKVAQLSKFKQEIENLDEVMKRTDFKEQQDLEAKSEI